jgi:hypothetical protein
MLDLPGEVTSIADGEVKIRFDQVSEAIAELLGRLIFLRHRRRLADVKKSRTL